MNNLFLVKKGDEANRPVVNLMELNKFISYQHVKMEGLHLPKLILQKVDLMSKFDLRVAYFVIPLRVDSRKFVRFEWTGGLCQFLSLYFELGQVERVFTKLNNFSLNFSVALNNDKNYCVSGRHDPVWLRSRGNFDGKGNSGFSRILFQKLGFIVNLKKMIGARSACRC